MNVCYCGAENGYPHNPDCPYPLFRASQTEEAKWYTARKELLRKRALGSYVINNLLDSANLLEPEQK